jgi:regulator of sigma E protease
VSWLLAFLGFTLLIVFHELGHFAVAKAVGMRVEKFSLFFPPTIACKRRGETDYCIGVIPAGGYVKISGMNPDEDLPDEVRTRAYYSQPVWKRIAVISAGPAVNLVLAFVLLVIFFAAIGPETASTRVGTIERGYPAAKALKPGDKLISVDGVRGGPTELAMQVSKHRCATRPPKDGCLGATPVRLVMERGGRRLELRIRPRYDADLKRPRLGFGYAPGPRDPLPFGEAADRSVDTFWFITKQTLGLPARLFDTEKRKDISSVVGGYEVTRQTILNDIAEVVGILAIISLSLAIINLFPFLPLDGGHIFWAVVEKVRGRPVPFSVMERAGVVGFLLVILFFLVGLTNDIDRLQGEGFRVR